MANELNSVLAGYQHIHRQLASAEFTARLLVDEGRVQDPASLYLLEHAILKFRDADATLRTALRVPVGALEPLDLLRAGQSHPVLPDPIPVP